jgi:NitT/TauT family transport system substrate-binding protein
MGKRKILIGSAFVVAVVLAVLCGYLWIRHADTPEQIAVGAYLGEFSSLLWVAEAEALFSKHGLDVQIDEYDSGVAPVRSLLAGEVEVATAAEFVAVSHIFENPELMILGTIAAAEAINVVARRNAGILEPQDLKNMRIGLKMRSQAEFFLGTFLIMNRLSIDDVVVVDIDPVKMEPALLAGDLDAVVVWHPFAHQIAMALGENASVWDAQSGQFFYFLLLTRQSVLSSRPDVVRRFLKAMVQASEYAQEHREKTRLLVRRRLGSKEGYSRAIWSKLGFGVEIPQNLIVLMEDEAGWMIRKGRTGAKEVPNYLNNLVIPLLEDIYPEGVTVFR